MKTTTKQPFITRTSLIQRTSYLLLSFMLVLGLALMGCEGPQGPQGEQGQQGEQGPDGPVGPAGEDGSVMYADEGAPGDNIGQNGDYYLNQNTGELYGPKDGDGWGNPIIVLMGEDGTDGQDGADGEDGSQIHSGSGAPGGSLGTTGDYYLDQDSYELYGPKTGSGWGSPLNLKGANGNANVTRYIFPGNDFNSDDFIARYIPDIESEAEMRQSAWLTYLILPTAVSDRVYQINGYGINGSSFYRSFHAYNDDFNEVSVLLRLVEGPGEAYSEIEIVRIEASSTEDLRKARVGGEGSIIPDDLDVSNYEEVAEYYGFGGVQ